MRTLLLALALVGASPVSWAGLLTTEVTGTLVFVGRLEDFFSSSRGFVPAGCANSGLGSTTVTVSGALNELCFESTTNRIVADFTDTSLFFTDRQALVGVNGFIATFTFAPGLVTGVAEVSDDYPAGMAFAFANDVLTLTYPGNTSSSDATFLARYDFTFRGGGSSVPEPSTVWLIPLGLAGAALLRARTRLGCPPGRVPFC